jgi:hypothetical protein
MILPKYAVFLLSAMNIVVIVGASAAATLLAAEAQIAIDQRGARIDPSIDQSIVQEQNAACNNESVEQSDDCKVVQNQAASNVARHDIVINSIRNIR